MQLLKKRCSFTPNPVSGTDLSLQKISNISLTNEIVQDIVP
jgi:hypothetical protein